jgi:PAS domain S-box-containing protein
VTELIRGAEWRCRPLAFCSSRKLVDIPSYDTRNTPCDIVLRLGSYFCADGLRDEFPEDPHFEELEVRSYRGMAIRTEDNQIVGHLGGLDDRPMEDSPTDKAIMEAYSTAASLEIRRRRAVRERHEAAERLSTLVEAIPDPVCLKDGDGQWLYANAAVINLFHLNGIDWRRKTDLELGEIQPQFADVLREIARVDAEVWQTKEPLVREELVPDGGNGVRIFEAARVPLFTDSGDRRGLVIVAREVTARRNAQNALRKSEEKFRSVSEHLPGAIYSDIRHPDGTRTLLYVSPGLTDLIGARAVIDLSGNVERFRRECVHPEDWESFEDASSDSFKTYKPLGHDFRIRTEAGSFKWVRSISQPVRAGDGNLLWYGMLLDITDRKDVTHHSGRLPIGWSEPAHAVDAPREKLDQVIDDIQTPLTSLVSQAEDAEAQESRADHPVRGKIARLGEQLLEAFREYSELSKRKTEDRG